MIYIPESVRRFLTFFFFYTVPGLIMATIIGGLMWLTLPVWVLLSAIIVWRDRR